jgi:hypothetical protein
VSELLAWFAAMPVAFSSAPLHIVIGELSGSTAFSKFCHKWRDFRGGGGGET